MTAHHLHLQPIDRPTHVPGFPLDDPYVEHVWAAITGPTSVAVLRRCALLFCDSPDGRTVDPGEFAATLGIGHRDDASGQLNRTLVRLHRYDLARWDEYTATLSVFTTVHVVPERLVRVLPEFTRALHDAHVATLPDRDLARAIAPVRRRTPSGGLSR